MDVPKDILDEIERIGAAASKLPPVERQAFIDAVEVEIDKILKKSWREKPPLL